MQLLSYKAPLMETLNSYPFSVEFVQTLGHLLGPTTC